MFLLADTGFFVAMEDFFLRLSEDDPKFILNINTFFIYLLLASMGFGYARWLKPFVANRYAAYATAGFYIAYTIFFNIIYTNETYALDGFEYGIKAASLLIQISLLFFLDGKRNPLQKIFLCSVFLTIRWLVLEIFTEISFFERDLILDRWPFQSSITAIVLECIVWELLRLAGQLALLDYSIRLLLKVYQNKSEELKLQEFIMLLLPAVLVMSVRQIIADYFDLWSQGIENGTIKANIPFDGHKLVYCILSYLILIVTITLYEQLKNSRDAAYRQAILERQMEDTNRQIERIEGFYQEMRSLRHDMGNHVAVLEGLIERGRGEEAIDYVSKLKDSLREVQPEFPTGNAITDVIISEFAEKLRAYGGVLDCSLTYPVDTAIDAFDLSIILNNALQNALEASRACDGGWVSVSSAQNDRVYMLDIRNYAASKREISAETGLSPSTKKEEGHGYGLSNMRRVARQYKGDIDIRQEERDGRVVYILHVMLIG